MYLIELNKKCRISKQTSNLLQNWEILLNIEVQEESDIQTILLGGNTYDQGGTEDDYEELNFNPEELLSEKPSQAKQETNLDHGEIVDCMVYNLILDGKLTNNKEKLAYRLFTDKGVYYGEMELEYKGVPTWVGLFLLADNVETLYRYDELFNNFK
jgi:hypothetical protein